MKRDLQRLYPWMAGIAVLMLIAGIATLSVLRPQEAPDFAGQVVSPGSEGDRIRLSDLRGRVVLVDFWASWCPPCQRSIPALNRIAQRYADEGVQVLGINVEQEIAPSEAGRRHRLLGAEFPTLHDNNGVIMQNYAVDSFPTLFVIDSAGRIRHVEVGETDESGVSRVIDELLSS